MMKHVYLSACCGAAPLGEVCVDEDVTGLCSRCHDHTTFDGELHRYFMNAPAEVTVDRIDDGDEDRRIWTYEIRAGHPIAHCATLQGVKDYCAAHGLVPRYQFD